MGKIEGVPQKKKKKIAPDTLLYNQQDFVVGKEIRRSKGGRRKKKGVVSLILAVWLFRKFKYKRYHSTLAL